jgi:3-methyladenine DNA glycosylase AlkD
MNIQEEFSKALQFISHHQDGEIAETLRYRGLQYNMIYGVSSNILYGFTKNISKNQELANLLWKEDFREAKLLALMLADPNTISNSDLEEILHGCNNHELVEIGTLHLFSKLPNAVEKTYEWSLIENEFIKMTAYMMISHLAKELKNVKIKELAKFLPVYETDFTHNSYFVRKALVNAFQEVAFRRPGLKAEIIKATKKLLKNNIGTENELQAIDMLHVLNYC